MRRPPSASTTARSPTRRSPTTRHSGPAGAARSAPAGYLCTEPIPHETAHVSTAPNGTEFDRWVTADLPFLAEEQAAGRCAAINEGHRYVCSLERGHTGAHTALAPADEPDADDEVVDTWIG